MTSADIGIATAIIAMLLFTSAFGSMSRSLKQIADALDRAHPKPVDVAPSDAELQAEMDAGGFIWAIRHYRNAVPGMTLKGAKDDVERLIAEGRLKKKP